ncbi:hypothetical protein D9757_004433 [Collybiopsis confluens]|uniref:Terpenoid synthase n=1 Tax=Collybiopsis confluens TaxID=2823264 RepID=A0A8H5MEC7_9AGAR|nr:hypothetical protein D9757_004433 [Collybiopsis confluens]
MKYNSASTHSTDNMQPMMSMTKEKIAEAIQTFLSRCSIPYQKPPTDEPFLELCYNEARKRGYMAEGSEELKPFIFLGAAMSFTAFAHLDDTVVQVWMALITGAAIYCDDRFLQDTGFLDVFCERLLRGQPQADRALNAFADLIVETTKYFPPLTANLIMASAMNFVNSIILDNRTLGMEVFAVADDYPLYTRIMSGLSEVYAIALFPAHLPVNIFIQAIPSMRISIVDVNDILSFYKEELAGETVNHISLWAKSRGCDKLQALYVIIQQTVEAHEKVVQILEKDPAALDAYYKFSSGYVQFHTVLDHKYHLDELNLS